VRIKGKNVNEAKDACRNNLKPLNILKNQINMKLR
jgi:hypothetical protein